MAATRHNGVPMFGETPLVRVDSQQQLEAMVKTLENTPVLGVDTEADSMHHYQEKVCLIQISDLTTDYIVDPLLVTDLSALAPIFASPNIVKIFHDCYFDVVSLRRDHGFTFQNLFDTMLGAQFAGMEGFGLASVIRTLFGHEIDKQYQRHDWAERPLLPQHLDYARGDTHFLAAIREFLIDRLVPLGRLHMLTEECEYLCSKTWNGRTKDPAAFLGIKGAKQLDEPGRRVLRALAEWREEEARRLDRPVFKTAPDEVLIQLAERQPTTNADVTGMLRSGSSLARRWSGDFVTAVKTGLADERPLPSEAAPRRPRPDRSPDDLRLRDQERVMAALKDWRTKVTREQRLPQICVVANGQFQEIARRAPADLDTLASLGEMRRWQVDAWGEQILQVVRSVEIRRGALDEERAGGEAAGDGTGEAGSGGGAGRRRRRKPAP